MGHILDYLSDLDRPGRRLSEVHMCARFAERILGGLLGYEPGEWDVNPHAGEDQADDGIPDLVIRVPNNGDSFAWIACEAKLDDQVIRDPARRQKLWIDKKKYVGGETVYFLWLARRTILVCDPKGTVLAGLYLEDNLIVDGVSGVLSTTDDLAAREQLDLISAAQGRSLHFLESFREGELPSRYLPIGHETIGQLTSTLRGTIMTLRSYLTRRWNDLEEQHRTYLRKRELLEERIRDRGSLLRPSEAELWRRRLDLQYHEARSLFEFAFPIFCNQQAYTAEPEGGGRWTLTRIIHEPPGHLKKGRG